MNESAAEPRRGRRAQIDRDEYAKLRAAIVLALEQSGKGQRAVSRALGRHETYLNEILMGRRTVEFAELLDLCDVIGANPVEIVRAAVAQEA